MKINILPKLRISLLQSIGIVWGILCCTVSGQFQIVDFSPKRGGPGTEIRIQIQGAETNEDGSPLTRDLPEADDLCVVLKRPDGRLLPIEVESINNQEIVGKLTAVDPEADGVEHQLMIARGHGERRRLLLEGPDFEGVLVNPDGKQPVPVWNWRGDLERAIAGPAPFIPIFRPIRPCAFHSGPPQNGTLCVTLDRDWGRGQRVCISARIHKAGTGADTRIGPVTFTLSGSREECAAIICRILKRAFAAHSTRPLNINCDWNAQGKITVVCPDGATIDGGHIDIICKRRPPVIRHVWNFVNRGIWRREFRRREVARWYRNYEWVTKNLIWLNRRAEGFWITGAALESFCCSSKCILKNPNGPGYWRIYRKFQRVDVRRFRKHYRISWLGQLNPLIRPVPEMQNRFALTLDKLEIVVPMEPQDPNPETEGINEAVEIIDENGNQFFLGQRGLELLPDTQMNPDGFQLLTTAISTEQLPPPEERIRETEMENMPGVVQTDEGVFVEWLTDEDQRVVVPGEATNEAPDILGKLGRGRWGLLDEPTGEDGNELNVNFDQNAPPLLVCWLLDQRGEVLLAPGEPSPEGVEAVGPPFFDDEDRPVGAFGAGIPMNPTVRDLEDNPETGIREIVVPGPPLDLALVEAGPPTDEELRILNGRLAEQGLRPLAAPFSLCFKQVKVRRIRGIDRRFVLDTWTHHWQWRLRNHFWLRKRAYRVWLSRRSISTFSASHHHKEFGKPRRWHGFTRTHVRFFRFCYRIVRPRPNLVRVKVDQLFVVVPVNPEDESEGLMLITTEPNESRLPSPKILSGETEDPEVAFDDEGQFVEALEPADIADILAGDASVIDLEGEKLGNFEMQDLLSRFNSAETLPADSSQDELPLYCYMLNVDGTHTGIQIELPRLNPTGGTEPIMDAVTLADGPVPALPVFSDEMSGEKVTRATMLTMNIGADRDSVAIRPNPEGGRAEVQYAPGTRLLRTSNLQPPFIEVDPDDDGFHVVQPDDPAKMFFLTEPVGFGVSFP